MDDTITFFNSLPPDLKLSIKKIHETILRNAIDRLYEGLDDETKGSLTNIFKNGSEEEKNNFLLAHIENIQKLVREEAEKSVQEIKN